LKGFTMNIRALLLPAAAIASASWAGLTATSCCNQHLCDGMRVLASQIASKYATCCQQGQTPDCMQGISNKTDATMGMLLGAKIACDAGDDAAARDLAKAIRDLWLPKIIRQLSPAGAQAAVWNTWPVFRNTDWVDLDVTLPMTADGCSTMAVVIVGNQVVTPEATGGAAEEEAAQSPGGTPGEETVAVVIPSGSPSAALACTYRVPSESQFSVRFGDPRESMDLSGTIKVA